MTIAYSSASVPGGLPVFGHAIQFGLNPLTFLRSAGDRGDVVEFRIGRSKTYLVNHPAMIRRILIDDAKCFNKGLEYEKVRSIFGNGLTTSSGPFHLRQRRMIQPAFHKTQLERYGQAMLSATGSAMEDWSDDQFLDIERVFRRLSLQIVARTLFASEIASEAVTEFEQSVPTLLDTVVRRAVSPLSLPAWVPTPRNRAARAAQLRVWGGLKTAVERYRGDKAERGDLLSVLLAAHDEESGARMTDRQVMDEAMTMLLSGFETAASTMCWTAHLLSTHPDVQERVRAELDRVLDTPLVQTADLPRLPYLRQVITEALRLYPPAWLLSRRVSTPVVIGGHRFEVGTRVFLSPYTAHRNAELYHDPDRFNPDRWSEPEASARLRTGFLSFGAGARGCIGEGFAWMEVMTVIGSVVSGWRLSPVADRRVTPSIKMLLQPSTLTLHVVRRTERSSSDVTR